MMRKTKKQAAQTVQSEGGVDPELVKALAWFVYRHEGALLSPAPFSFSYTTSKNENGSYTVTGSLGE